MLKAGIGLVRESGRIFLEAAPRGLDPVTIAEAIRALPAVTRLDDLHVWEVTSGMPALSGDRKSTRLNSRSLMRISYAVFCLKKKKKQINNKRRTRLT